LVPKIKVIKKGTTGKFICVSNEAKVTFLFEGESLPNNCKIMYDNKKRFTLVISKATLQNSGDYYCLTNEDRKNGSEPYLSDRRAYLYVQGITNET